MQQTAAVKDENENYAKAKIISDPTQQAESDPHLDYDVCKFDRFGYQLKRYKRNTDSINYTRQGGQDDIGGVG